MFRVSSKNIIAKMDTMIGLVCVMAIARVASSDLRPTNIVANPIPMEIPEASATSRYLTELCSGTPEKMIIGRQ